MKGSPPESIWMASGADEIIIDDGTEGACDGSSIFEDSSRMSLASSLNRYRLENNRPYHTYRDGSYWVPQDQEALRLDVIAHHIWLLTFDDALFLAPLSRPKRVIDVGTGVGIWATNFAEQYPDADVIATDLSLCQYEPVPMNLHFEIDDACSEWIYPPDHFDYVHVRLLYASISDWPAFYKECYDHLAPGGFIEHAEINPVLKTDDPTVDLEKIFQNQGALAREASANFGKPLVIQPHLKSMIEKAGFVDVVERQYKWPIGDWPADAKLKQVGSWNAQHWIEGIESWTLRLLTQHMGWTVEEVKAWADKVRSAVWNQKHHAYQSVSVVYARKPFTT